MISKQNKYCFLSKKVGCNHATSPLYEPGVLLRFKIWTPTSLLAYIDTIYGLHLKGQRQIFSQNWIEFNINRHGFIPKCAMARQWLFDISYLLRRFTHDSYAWWTHEIISYNHGIYSFILVYFNKRFFLISILWLVMNEEMTEKCLRQVEFICGHLLHRYSITVNQVVVAA